MIGMTTMNMVNAVATEVAAQAEAMEVVCRVATVPEAVAVMANVMIWTWMNTGNAEVYEVQARTAE